MPQKKTAKKPVKRSSSKSKKARTSSKSKSILHKKSIQKSAAVLVVFSFSILFLFGLSLYKKVTLSFASADSTGSYDMTSEDLVSVAVLKVDSFDQDPIFITQIDYFIFDLKDNKLLDISIPIETELDMSGKFGVEQLRKYYALAFSISEGDQKQTREILKDNMGIMLHYPTDKIMIVDESSEIGNKSFFKKGGISILDILEMTNIGDFVNTDLSINEYYFLHKFVNSLDDNDISKYSGTEVSEQLRNLTFDSDIAQEQLSVAVLNGTSTTGVAGEISEFVENMGGRVISTENAANQFSNTYIVTDNTSSVTARKLARFLDTKLVLNKDSFLMIDPNYKLESEVGRSDITVIVGVDTLNSL